MASPTTPSLLSTMRAWSITSIKTGTPVQNMHLNTLPIPTIAPAPAHSTLIRTAYTSLNQIDIRLVMLPYFGRYIFPLPATPSQECTGRVVSTTHPDLRVGQLVTTRLQRQRGALAQYVLIHGKAAVAAVPEGVGAAEAATAGTCGMLAVQTMRLITKERGDQSRRTRVFVNGASGGVGSWMVQAARIMDMDVVASCSGINVELVKGLGAIEVLDYKKVDVGRELGNRVESGDLEAFDAIIDTQGRPRKGLYKDSERFLRQDGTYIQVGGDVSLAEGLDMMMLKYWPAFLGGGKRNWVFPAVQNKSEDMATALKWMSEGKVKVPVEVVPFEDASRGYEKLMSGKVRGKIVVKVGDGE